MHFDGKAVVLVYSDIFVEHEFDDLSKLHSEVEFLRLQGVSKIDIVHGFLKILVCILLFFAFLKAIVVIKALI